MRGYVSGTNASDLVHLERDSFRMPRIFPRPIDDFVLLKLRRNIRAICIFFFD